jgi:PAS domain S-box-containing protein
VKIRSEPLPEGHDALRRSEKRLRDIIDGLGPSMFVGLMTPDGVLIEANRPALVAAGLTPDDVLGKPFEDTYWWTYSPDVQRQLRAAIARAARGEASRYDVRLRVSNDQLIDVDFCLQPLRGDDGEVAFLVPSATVITARKQTENALRESDEMFRLLADNITDAFWIRSPDMSEVLYVSPAFERIWGVKVGQLYANSHTWIDFVAPEDRERVTREFLALTAGRSSIDLEYRIVRPDGEIRWIRTRGFQVRDSAGTLVRLTGIVTDVTEKTRAADALDALSQRTARRERMLSTTLSSISDFAAIYDRDGRFLFANQPLLDLWGITLEEALGRNFLDLGYPSALAGQLQRQVEAVFETGTRITGEAPYLNARGMHGFYEYIFSPVPRADGTTEFVVGSTRDVTERNRAADALRVSAEEFRSLAEAMPQMVWITGPDGDCLYCTQQWMAYTGLTLAESLGSGWTKPFHPDDRSMTWDAWQHATTTIGTYSVECRLRRTDGIYRWWLVRGVPQLDDAGRVVKWFGTCTDIHDLKVAEFEIARTNRALKMLSASSETLIRAEQEQGLLDSICRVAVETGGYLMAWVGYARDDASRSISPMAHAGREEGYLSDVKVSWDETDPLGRGPAGQVIRSGLAVVCDYDQDPHLAPWREQASQHGYRSVISLPLRDATRTFGLLVLHSADAATPGAEELKLLQEMADNLAFGIGNLRARVEQRRVHAAVVTAATSVSAATGTDFFEQLARSMATAVGASAGVVTQLLPVEPVMGRTIAAVVDGGVREGFDFAIAGTPCEALLTRDSCVISSAVASRFPHSALLAELGAEGYAGLRLESSSGRPLGMLFVIFREPPQHVEFINSTLRIFAARAASELERQQTDAQLREQAALLDIAHEAIQLIDLDGRFLFWNKGAERTYGWTLAEALGRSSVELLDDDPSSFGIARAAVLATGEWAGEMIRQTRRGRSITVDVRCTLVQDVDGRPKAILAINTDVTEKRTLESQLMVSDRMASMGTLAAGVAHEINNPLAAVVGNLEYVAESFTRLRSGQPPSGFAGRTDEWISEEIAGPLADALDAAQRVRFIVRDLMIFSRSPNDETTKPVNVKAILESSLGMAGNEIRHRARLTRRYAAVPDVEANEARLGQVFLNLIVNAAQSVPEGHTEQNEICVSTRLDGDRVVVEVTDTGAGIPPEIMGRIFDAFFTTKAVGAGTGLGLAICQRIITDMGGELTVESEVGVGTTFRVALPVAPHADAEVETLAAPMTATGRRGRILLVDDEEMVVRIVQRSLSTEHDVVATVAAREALAICAGGASFDLIICDLMMPDMTGMDLHRELSIIAPDQADRMVFLTGGAFTANARQFLLETPREHIEKPFTQASLRALARRYVR